MSFGAQPTDPQAPPPDATAAEPIAVSAVEKSCHRCGAELPLDAQVCSHCGQKLYRLCFCGQAFPSNLSSCPACGTDWVKSVRVRRRSRTDKVKPRALVHRAVWGACIAVLATGLFNLVISGLARSATPEGIVPRALGLRLYFAWHTLATGVSKLVNLFTGGVLYTLLIALGGAAVGVLVYLLPARLGRVSRVLRHDRVRRRRSHR